jgi:hypothetical protein
MECVEKLGKGQVNVRLAELVRHVRLANFNHSDIQETLSAMAEEFSVPYGELSSYAYLLIVAKESGQSFEEIPSLKKIWQQVMPEEQFEVFEAYFMALAQRVYEQNLEAELKDGFDRCGQEAWGEGRLSLEEEEFLLDLQEDAVFDGDLP